MLESGGAGWIVVENDEVTLDFQDATPITVEASANPSEIGTGTGEVVITYAIINNEDNKEKPTKKYKIPSKEIKCSLLNYYRFKRNCICVAYKPQGIIKPVLIYTKGF